MDKLTIFSITLKSSGRDECYAGLIGFKGQQGAEAAQIIAVYSKYSSLYGC